MCCGQRRCLRFRADSYAVANARVLYEVVVGCDSTELDAAAQDQADAVAKNLFQELVDEEDEAVTTNQFCTLADANADVQSDDSPTPSNRIFFEDAAPPPDFQSPSQ